MTTLLKAQLCEISGDAAGKEIGAPVDVQFNPATLRVAISNKTAGGSQAGAQAKQKPGTGEVTVTFDLYFDTADEGTADAPIPVTRRTQIVEKFVRPRGATPALQSPPRVQFKWGGFLVQGVMESANIDLDLFAADGTPLRAKVGVSIKGQDPSYRDDPALLPPVAPGGDSAAPSGLPAGTPGTTGNAGPPTTVAEALPGESLAAACRAQRAGPDRLASAGNRHHGTALAAGRPGSAAARGRPAVVAAPARPQAELPWVAARWPARRPAAPTRSWSARRWPGRAACRAPSPALAAMRSAARRPPASPASAWRRPRPAADRAPSAAAFRCAHCSAPPAPPPVTPDPTIPGWQALAARPPTQIRAAGRIQPRSACACGCAPKRRG